MPRHSTAYVLATLAGVAVLSVSASMLLLRGTPATAQAGGSAAAQSASPSIAVCTVVEIVDELMRSDRFAPTRTAREEELRNELIAPLQEEAQELEAAAQQIQAAGGDLGPVQQQFNSLQARFQQANSQFSQQIDAFTAGQLAECHELVRTSAAAIAEEKGYAYVVGSSRPSDDFGNNARAVTASFGLRPMLVFPEDVDITEDVRADLNL